MKKSIFTHSFINFIWEWIFYWRVNIFDHTPLKSLKNIKDEAAIFLQFTLMQLFWRSWMEIVKNSFLFLIIRDIHDQDDFRHIFAQTRISILRARPFYSPLFRPDIGNKWISFPVTLVRRFILSRINARADLSFARIRFVADL